MSAAGFAGAKGVFGTCWLLGLLVLLVATLPPDIPPKARMLGGCVSALLFVVAGLSTLFYPAEEARRTINLAGVDYPLALVLTAPIVLAALVFPFIRSIFDPRNRL